MAVTEALTRHCSSCGMERPFVQPPCRDGHGDDCPEWVCVSCGEVLLIGVPPIDGWAIDDLPVDDAPAASAKPGSPSQAA